MLVIPKTKTKKEINESEYIFPLALKMKEYLTNEDISLCISVLSESEKIILKNRLLQMKVEVKTPDDFKINRKIYLTIAIIMDKTTINQNKEKNILSSKK